MDRKLIILSAVLMLGNFTIRVGAQNPATFGIGTYPVGTLHVHSATPIQEEAGFEPYSGEASMDNYRTIFHITNAVTTKTADRGFSIIRENGLVTLRQFESSNFRIQGFNEQGLTIATNGFVGVGTDNPSHRLHVAGNANVQGTMNVSTTFCMGIDNQTFTAGKAHFPDLNYGSTYIGFNAVRGGGNSGTWVCQTNTWQNGGAVIWATMEGDLLFANIPRSSSGSSNQTGLTDADIKSNVNLKLGADGLLMAKEIKVTLTDWPDYVFDESHSLPSLETTEAYIKDNGHLPGVPSAAEIEQDGSDLGQMNKILMQKVEELTLQVIELNKQLKELKGE